MRPLIRTVWAGTNYPWLASSHTHIFTFIIFIGTLFNYNFQYNTPTSTWLIRKHRWKQSAAGSQMAVTMSWHLGAEISETNINQRHRCHMFDSMLILQPQEFISKPNYLVPLLAANKQANIWANKELMRSHTSVCWCCEKLSYAWTTLSHY